MTQAEYICTKSHALDLSEALTRLIRDMRFDHESAKELDSLCADIEEIAMRVDIINMNRGA